MWEGKEKDTDKRRGGETKEKGKKCYEFTDKLDRNNVRKIYVKIIRMRM